MVYLVILVVVAAAGLLRLWLQHRREVGNRHTDIDGLRARLEKVTSRPSLGRAPDAGRESSAGRGRGRHSVGSTSVAPVRPEPQTRFAPSASHDPMEPERREAARRRIEARRRAQAAG